MTQFALLSWFAGAPVLVKCWFVWEFLKHEDQLLAGKGSNTNAVAKLTRDYMEKFADLEATTTMNNYNPLIEDFSNTSVFMGVSRLKTL